MHWRGGIISTEGSELVLFLLILNVSKEASFDYIPNTILLDFSAYLLYSARPSSRVAG